MSDYVTSIRSRIGTDLLLLPGVTAVIRDGERFLLARHAHSGQWSLIGGGIEPGEEPSEALLREVREETGAHVRIRGIIGAYGGPAMTVAYPNGDQVGYVTTAYDCELQSAAAPNLDDILELGWFSRGAIKTLPRREWIDRVIDDVPTSGPSTRLDEGTPITFSRLEPLVHDHAALVDFMTRNEFPFHGRARPTRDSVEAAIDAGQYRDDDNDSFWVDHAAHGRIGFLRLEDLSDPTPVFDLRLDERFRGRGLGSLVVRAAADLVFTTMPTVRRFEGQTREDNLSMRKAFRRAGWLKKAHYREGWPIEGAEPVASVAYAILRRDWETGETTTFVWDDLA